MKKSVIKRRKRVIPTNQSIQIDTSRNLIEASESDLIPNFQVSRGSINLDGSVNLGHRMQSCQNQILPGPQNNHHHSGMETSSSNSSSNPISHNHNPLTIDNCPPQIKATHSLSKSYSISQPSDNKSLLDKNNSRLFFGTDREFMTQAAIKPLKQSYNRPGSINSLLNPGHENLVPPRLEESTGCLPHFYKNSSHLIDSVSDKTQIKTARAKQVRMELLQREAEKIREALKAKEQEMEELGSK